MREAIQTVNVAPPSGHYSQAVRAGNLLFISGQLPLDRDGNIVRGSIGREVTQALENIRGIVEAAKGSIGDIVQCTIYVSDVSLWPDVNEIYGAFFASVPVLPARAVVPVKELHHGAHIEIQAIAVLKQS
jgi:reactive intermediate/imine deaminase